MRTVKVLITFRGNVDGASVPMQAGDVVDLPDGPARMFEAAGMVQLVEPLPPTVKLVNKPKAPAGKRVKEQQDGDN